MKFRCEVGHVTEGVIVSGGGVYCPRCYEGWLVGRFGVRRDVGDVGRVCIPVRKDGC
jgi:hypothetical protein